MKITIHDRRVSMDAKKKREWIRTEWKEVESIANENNLCYSTWYARIQAGKSAIEAASYPPCPIKGRKMKGKNDD